MFKYHGYSGPCPKPPLPREKPYLERVEDTARLVYAEWDKLRGTGNTNSLELHNRMEELGRLLNANVK